MLACMFREASVRFRFMHATVRAVSAFVSDRLSLTGAYFELHRFEHALATGRHET